MHRRIRSSRSFGRLPLLRNPRHPAGAACHLAISRIGSGVHAGSVTSETVRRASGKGTPGPHAVRLEPHNGGRTNTSQCDAAVISHDSNDRPKGPQIWGYGRYDDDNYDGQLRVGVLKNLSGGHSNRTVKSDYGESDAHGCKGDSGAPYQHPLYVGGPAAGIVFGLHSTSEGDGACGEDWSRGPMASRNDEWSRDRINEGAGSCSDRELPVQADPCSPSTPESLPFHPSPHRGWTTEPWQRRECEPVLSK